MKTLRHLVVTVCVLLGGVAAAPSAQAAPTVEYSKKNCTAIYNTLRSLGATKSQANYLGIKIAWRESGCSLQCVSDHDDHSCSRFGLNFKGRMYQFWGKLCGAWSRNATRILKVDARCALKALRMLGTKPWRRR